MNELRSNKSVRLVRGAQKLLLDMGYDSLTEIKLCSCRRLLAIENPIKEKFNVF